MKRVWHYGKRTFQAVAILGLVASAIRMIANPDWFPARSLVIIALFGVAIDMFTTWFPAPRDRVAEVLAEHDKQEGR